MASDLYPKGPTMMELLASLAQRVEALEKKSSKK